VLTAFKKNSEVKQLFEPGQQVLLAISGGPDSVALAHLLKSSGITFALAHCNFQLRGKDSNADETFCKQLAKKLGAEIYIQKFDTAGFAKKNKLSIQLAARRLRYDWFYELLDKKKNCIG
jgi:tRNA(Ile)-lysidine synthase